MKLKSSKMKKILTCLLIGGSLTGSVGANAFANSNSNGVQYASKEVSDKLIKEIKEAYKSRVAGFSFEYYPKDSCWLVSKSGYLYQIHTSGLAVVGVDEVFDRTFYFNRRTCAAERGWYNVTDGGSYNGRYYFSNSGALENDFYDIGNERFYFDDKGRVQKGLIEVNGRTYRGTNKTGAIVTGWWSEGNDRYFFDPNKGGAAHEGWYRDGNAGNMYFDSKGRMLTGLQKFNSRSIYLFQPHGKGANYYTTSGFYSTNSGARYYFNPNDSDRALVDAWLDTGAGFYVGNGRMYFKPDGTMANGVTEICGEKYLFTQAEHFSVRLNAYQRFGWYTEPFTNNTYYFKPETGTARSMSNTPVGAAVKGVQYIDGVRYEFGQDGVLKK